MWLYFYLHQVAKLQSKRSLRFWLGLFVFIFLDVLGIFFLWNFKQDFTPPDTAPWIFQYSSFMQLPLGFFILFFGAMFARKSRRQVIYKSRPLRPLKKLSLFIFVALMVIIPNLYLPEWWIGYLEQKGWQHCETINPHKRFTQVYSVFTQENRPCP